MLLYSLIGGMDKAGEVLKLLLPASMLIDLLHPTLSLVEKIPIIPVRAGHWSRLLNWDQLLGTNAGLGSSMNRDQWVSTWRRAARGGGSLVPVCGTNRDRWSLHFVLFFVFFSIYLFGVLYSI
jgi:hypothetical protein